MQRRRAARETEVLIDDLRTIGVIDEDEDEGDPPWDPCECGSYYTDTCRCDAREVG